MKTATKFLIFAAYFLAPSASHGMHSSPLASYKHQILGSALFDCNTAKLTSLLADYPDMANFRNSVDYTPLHILAGKLVCTDCVKLLNAAVTPEHQARLKEVYGAIQNMIRVLVKHGADINAAKTTKVGSTLVQNETPLLHACRHSCALTIETLLSCGADAKVCNSDGETALTLIVRREKLAPHCLTQAITLLHQYNAT